MRVRLVIREHKVLKVLRGLIQELKVVQVLQGLQVHKGLKVRLQVRQDQKDL